MWYHVYMTSLLIYGANGYTGSLIAREAARRGLEPVLGARNAEGVSALARELGLATRVFDLDNPIVVDRNLRDVSVVLHCAGPFARTFQPMADACLRTKVHYLDITGEENVFETLAGRDGEAKTAGIMLLPGVGFDVVPTDCLAAHLKKRLPAATHLALAIKSSSRMSRGTALTVIEGMHTGGLVRHEGVLKKVPAAWKTRPIDFGRGPAKAITIPWGDVASAYYSTGIPNIEVYMEAPFGVRTAVRLSRFLGWALASRPVQAYLKNRVRAGSPGPTDEERARGKSYFWGEVTDGAGNKAEAHLQGPESYTLTVLTALAVVERVLAGHAPAGYQTPSTAYGPDFVLGVKGVTREDRTAGIMR
ncbi:MAG TPA: saccharopine dehydrogenase NADP-binding domain-containing protein [Gemmataceae bacterium]|jgi:short subunit dehydrogenase-like uncharacterized protein|nr:saccharopine dehydrogenase NADP-binding domain-containing protein [Gemmataceae bacterium]